eukprot:14809649-Alexandrium_andersonii.AAC.1
MSAFGPTIAYDEPSQELLLPSLAPHRSFSLPALTWRTLPMTRARVLRRRLPRRRLLRHRRP